ncbi:MAG: XRE family transcriptional regulator [Flavobacteriales bacterium]
MATFAELLRHYRKQKGVTQAVLAEALGLNRPVIGAYEEGRAEPKLEVLRNMAQYFAITVDELTSGEAPVAAPAGELRVLPIVVDSSSNSERVPLVPVKAAAGYLSGFQDPEFIEQLATFEMPFKELARERTYRMFQIEGDSMLPVPSGSYIISNFVEGLNQVKDGETYIVVSESEGIVFKRVFKEGTSLKLVSDNPVFEPYAIPMSDVREIWKATGFVSFGL